MKLRLSAIAVLAVVSLSFSCVSPAQNKRVSSQSAASAIGKHLLGIGKKLDLIDRKKEAKVVESVAKRLLSGGDGRRPMLRQTPSGGS